MTLEEAIYRARETGLKLSRKCETREWGKEHIQLAKWLAELKAYREGWKPDAETRSRILSEEAGT